MKPNTILRHVMEPMRSATDAFADNCRRSNLHYALADAVPTAFACFFLQSLFFLFFSKDVGRPLKASVATHVQILYRKKDLFYYRKLQIQNR